MVPHSHHRLLGCLGTWWGRPSPSVKGEMDEHHRHKVRNTGMRRTAVQTEDAWGSSHPAQPLSEMAAVQLWEGARTQLT